eukprot:gene30562-62164_t
MVTAAGLPLVFFVAAEPPPQPSAPPSAGPCGCSVSTTVFTGPQVELMDG